MPRQEHEGSPFYSRNSQTACPDVGKRLSTPTISWCSQVGTKFKPQPLYCKNRKISLRVGVFLLLLFLRWSSLCTSKHMLFSQLIHFKALQKKCKAVGGAAAVTLNDIPLCAMSGKSVWHQFVLSYHLVAWHFCCCSAWESMWTKVFFGWDPALRWEDVLMRLTHQNSHVHLMNCICWKGLFCLCVSVFGVFTPADRTEKGFRAALILSHSHYVLQNEEPVSVTPFPTEAVRSPGGRALSELPCVEEVMDKVWRSPKWRPCGLLSHLIYSQYWM